MRPILIAFSIVPALTIFGAGIYVGYQHQQTETGYVEVIVRADGNSRILQLVLNGKAIGWVRLSPEAATSIGNRLGMGVRI